MAFSGDAMCTSFKQELMMAEHNFDTGHTFKMSLYDNSAVLTIATTVYTASGELADTGNYAAPGQALDNVLSPAIGSGEAWTDFDDEVWGTATFTAYGALIYNDTHATDAAIVVLDFTEAKTATAGDFTVQFPAPAAGTAIIRIA
jgi:hypothetical protein